MRVGYQADVELALFIDELGEGVKRNALVAQQDIADLLLDADSSCRVTVLSGSALLSPGRGQKGATRLASFLFIATASALLGLVPICFGRILPLYSLLGPLELSSGDRAAAPPASGISVALLRQPLS